MGRRHAGWGLSSAPVDHEGQLSVIQIAVGQLPRLVAVCVCVCVWARVGWGLMLHSLFISALCVFDLSLTLTYSISSMTVYMFHGLYLHTLRVLSTYFSTSIYAYAVFILHELLCVHYQF